MTAVTGLSRPVQLNAGHVLEAGAVQRPQARVMHQRTSGDGEIDLTSPRAAHGAIQAGADFGLFFVERNSRLRWKSSASTPSAHVHLFEIYPREIAEDIGDYAASQPGGGERCWCVVLADRELAVSGLAGNRQRGQ